MLACTRAHAAAAQVIAPLAIFTESQLRRAKRELLRSGRPDMPTQANMRRGRGGAGGVARRPTLAALGVT